MNTQHMNGTSHASLTPTASPYHNGQHGPTTGALQVRQEATVHRPTCLEYSEIDYTGDYKANEAQAGSNKGINND